AGAALVSLLGVKAIQRRLLRVASKRRNLGKGAVAGKRGAVPQRSGLPQSDGCSGGAGGLAPVLIERRGAGAGRTGMSPRYPVARGGTMRSRTKAPSRDV